VAAEASVLSASDELALGDILDRLRTTIDQRRLHLKPSFKDYDKLNRLQCSKEQLAAVLDKMKLHETQPEIDLIFNGFKAAEGLHPKGKEFFDYGKFLGSVNP